MALTYANYIKVPELLNLQEPKSAPAEHDEMLFIIIHQTYELWFKLLLHEIAKIGDNFSVGETYPAIAGLQRIRTVMKTLVGQMDILETMTPMSFSSFRDRLETASGFQSVQYRELEFALGYKRAKTLQYYTHDPDGLLKLQQRLEAPSLIDCFYKFLEHFGVKIPQQLINQDKTLANEPSDEIQDALLDIYKTRPDVAILFELMTDFDEGLQEWRYRHVKVVERTIGNKTGTGGSLGVEFLKQTLFKPIFPDLWAIRHRL